MDDKIKISPNLRPIVLECPQCGSPAIVEPKGYFVQHFYDDGDENFTAGIIRWTLFACEQEHALLTTEHEAHGAYGANGLEEADLDTPDLVYPSQNRPLSTEIPNELREIHQEARSCIQAKAYTAAAVMAGRALEGVCILNNIQGKNLHDQLSKMKEDGLIDGRLWEWADMLRTVRNSAAHFSGEQISRQDAEDVVAFTEALLDYLYVLTVRFDAFKARRARDLYMRQQVYAAAGSASMRSGVAVAVQDHGEATE